MTAGAYVIGVDFGTASGRAVLVDCVDGRELATASYPYANGVIDERLPKPHDHVRLEPDWALQDPEDYLRTFEHAVPRVLAESGIDADQVIGIGIDFTSCTMLPTTADGTPLCLLEELRGEPHAWVKLWKHHAAQPEADRINAVAAERGERVAPPLRRQDLLRVVLREGAADPRRGARDLRPGGAADRGRRLGRLAAHRDETRNSCTAGYKAMWSKRDGFPDNAYFAALDPRFEHVVDEKMSRTLLPLGSGAGVSDRTSGGVDRPPRRARRWRSPTSTHTSRLPRRP